MDLYIACSKRILQCPHTKCQILCLFVNFNNLLNRTVISQFFSKIMEPFFCLSSKHLGQKTSYVR